MKSIHKNRLLKLAAHLEKGKLGHKVFAFAYINANARGLELKRNGCGTMGCAIGECPIAFPNDWRFHKGRPVLNMSKNCRKGLG